VGKIKNGGESPSTCRYPNQKNKSLETARQIVEFPLRKLPKPVYMNEPQKKKKKKKQKNQKKRKTKKKTQKTPGGGGGGGSCLFLRRWKPKKT